MAGIAGVMREVHRLRRYARELQEQLDRIPRQLQAQQARVAKEEVALTDAEDWAAKLPGLEAAVQKARQDYSNYQMSIAEREGGLKAQLAEANLQLNQVEAQIPAKHRPHYNRLVASMGVEALAAVRGRS